MKSFWFFIHSLLFLISNFSISQYIPPLPDPRDDLTRPSSLMAIKRQMFPNYIIPVNTSEIEEVNFQFYFSSYIFYKESVGI